MPRRIDIPCDELCTSYLAGQTTLSLARRYDCCPATIANRLRKCGLTLRSGHFQPVAVSETELRRLYLEDRLPIKAIAAHFGVAVSTVGNKRRRYQIPVRPRR